MLVIADSSPLHYLVLIDHAAILPTLFVRVLIPPMVAEELQRSRTPAPVRAWIASPPDWLEVYLPHQPRLSMRLLPYLQQCESIAVFSKLKACLSGPFMPNDENSTSNHPRNIQFELFLASTLWQSGFQPVLGEHPDLKCRVENKWFFFECKRLFSTSPQALRDRIREAADQIRKDRRKAPPGTRGIIAIISSLNLRYFHEHATLLACSLPSIY